MKEKILNFLLIFMSLYLILSFFTWNTNKEVIDNTIKLTATKNSYTVPADVELNITNNTSSWVVIDTCKDLLVKKDTKVIVNKECWVINLKTKESTKIKYSNSYQDFYDIWEYFAVLKVNSKEVITKFDIEHKWFISKLFVFLFYAPIYNLMAYLLEITNYSLWWAIVIVTIIIRLLLLYPQHKMMVSQKKMQLIQPKIKEVQDKYKWNQQMLWMELMKLYKEEWVNPMWSCWLLLIQMPILIVIYNVIIWIQSQSNNYYLYSFLWDYNLINITDKFFWINLFEIWWVNWLVLSIIVALLQYIQVKLSLNYNKVYNKNLVIEKKKDSNDFQSLMPDPELLNKFMLYWMPIMIWFATYTFFAWVWLYWWIWTIFMIVQQLVVNKILKK